MALERLLPSDEIMGPDTYRKINAAIDEVNEMQRASYYGYGDPNQRPLTKPRQETVDDTRAPFMPVGNRDMPALRDVDWNGTNDSGWVSKPNKEPKPGGMSEAEQRKQHPMATGVLDYFPDALYEIAEVSKIGNDQHNPGQPLHWAKGKSDDHADALLRHLKDRGKWDVDPQGRRVRHSAKVAWRALANLQTEIENERKNGYINPTTTQQKENHS